MIDRATVDRIIDAADIVEVVSDFVTLKKRGKDWLGLCPFHNDRRPSFNVSRTKGIYKCFACGAGGGVVNFVMQHEQMTYVEALRYLAKKYHIEIEERELTDEERMAQNERESMLVVNEFAMQFFEEQLANTTDGQEIGMAYFKERGFTQESIKKFHLGYSPEGRSALYDAAIKKGYNRQILIDVGLCIDDGHGGGYDRFRGRVMFPVFNIAGKVVAFGGRTLRNDRAKYVNSPESAVYSKSNEIYGLFQAKRAITKTDKCYIVEGYADVISMHQSGFENVIASSGTALTEGHIHKIHRFTQNVTELFDGDEAGVHAALRGVDLLLKQGMNIKILLLPEGEDPDSFARSHGASEVKQYIEEHETDFITFKSEVLLKDSHNDPIKRSGAIRDIIQSIALIPERITRSIYGKECSKLFDIDESVIMAEVGKQFEKNREKDYREKQRREDDSQQQGRMIPPPDVPDSGILTGEHHGKPLNREGQSGTKVLLEPFERDLIRYVVKYGMCYFCDTNNGDGTNRPTTLVEFVKNELASDGMAFTNAVYKRIFEESVSLIGPFYEALAEKCAQLEQQMEDEIKAGIVEIQRKGVTDLEDAEKQEEQLRSRVASKYHKEVEEFRLQYLQKRLSSDTDDLLRETVLNFVIDKYQLSRIHTQLGAVVVTEADRLTTFVPKAINAWKNARVNKRRHEIQQLLEHATPDEQRELFVELQKLDELRGELARLTGEPVINSL